MAQKPETKFKDKVWPLLKEIPRSEWVKTQMVSVRGVPDWIGCVNGFAVFMEMKADGGKADALQKYRLTKAGISGAYVSLLEPSNLEKVLLDLRALSSIEKPIAHNCQIIYY